ncbi:butyrophilin subfamily 3 member A2-like isoform 2-T3 [Odontesthes bonariensis]
MNIEGFSPVIVRFNLVFLLLFSVLTPVQGQYQVIGPLRPVVASPGNDVILPCHVEPTFNTVDLTVEWSKPDLRPDPNDRLGRVDYVHLYRDNREVLDMKIPSYIGRTTLSADGMTQGNVALKITNVTAADEGRYKCFIPKLKGRTRSSIVHLTVAKSGTTETPLRSDNLQTPDPAEGTDVNDSLSRWNGLIPLLVFCVLLIAGVGVGGCLYMALKCRK